MKILHNLGNRRLISKRASSHCARGIQDRESIGSMEDPCSVSSPRRILSVSKRRRARDEKGPGFGLSGEHGPKPSEVYGFVGSISTVVATVIYLIWAYLPHSSLHSIGIYYYPSRSVLRPIRILFAIRITNLNLILPLYSTVKIGIVHKHSQIYNKNMLLMKKVIGMCSS